MFQLSVFKGEKRSHVCTRPLVEGPPRGHTCLPHQAFMAGSRRTATEHLQAGGPQRALLVATPPPALPLRPVSWALLLLQFTARSGVNGTRFATSATAGWSVRHRLPGHPSKQRPGEEWPASPHCRHLSQPFLGALPGEGPYPLHHWLSRQVPTRLADGVRVTCDTLRPGKKEPCLLSASGTHTATCCRQPHAISKSSVTTVPLRARDSQESGQYEFCEETKLLAWETGAENSGKTDLGSAEDSTSFQATRAKKPSGFCEVIWQGGL